MKKYKLDKEFTTENTPGYPPFNPNREYHPFERFQYNGVVAECRNFELFNMCQDCAIYPCGVTYLNCMAFKRVDKIDVFYKKLENVTEK